MLLGKPVRGPLKLTYPLGSIEVDAFEINDTFSSFRQARHPIRTTRKGLHPRHQEGEPWDNLFVRGKGVAIGDEVQIDEVPHQE